MHYSKPMIELVFEIRRRVSAQVKPEIKLANPDLLSELGDLYHNSGDTILRTLIKELLSNAGEEWMQLLRDPEAKPHSKTVKVYRGQTSLDEKQFAAQSVDEPEPDPHRPVRYYRGVRIA